MPCSRQTSSTLAPASTCFNTPTIWLSVNRDFFFAASCAHSHRNSNQRCLRLGEVDTSSLAVLCRQEVIMKPTTLSVHIIHFLSHYLAGQRNLSPNTVKAYRDVFVLLLRFCRDAQGIAVEKLELQKIDFVLIDAFLDCLVPERRNFGMGCGSWLTRAWLHPLPIISPFRKDRSYRDFP